MIIDPVATETPPLRDYAALAHHPRFAAWGAIFAGWTAATSLQVLFIMLGAGLGFAIYAPTTDENPVASLGTGAIVIQGLSAVFSLWFGGWVAGRLLPVTARQSSWVHGFVVWGASTVAGVIVVATGAGWATGALSKLVGGGLSAVGQPAAAAVGGAGDMAKDAIAQSRDTLSSFTGESLGKMSNRDAGSAEAVRAKREVSMALARLFSPTQEDKMQENKTALVKVLTEQTGRTETEANQLVSEWTDSYNRLKQDLKVAKDQAEAKARQVAEEASHDLAIFSLCSFFAFALGAYSAAMGAKHGAECAEKSDTRNLTSLGSF